MKSSQMQTCSLAFFLCSIIFFTPIITIKIAQPSNMPTVLTDTTNVNVLPGPSDETLLQGQSRGLEAMKTLTTGYLTSNHYTVPTVNQDINLDTSLQQPNQLVPTPASSASNRLNSPSIDLTSYRLNTEQAAPSISTKQQLSVDNPQPDALQSTNIDIYREIIKISKIDAEVTVELIKLKLPEIRAILIYFSGPEIIGKDGNLCSVELFFDDKSLSRQLYKDLPKNAGVPLVFNSIYNKADKAKEHTISIKLTGKCEIASGEALIFTKAYYCGNK